MSTTLKYLEDHTILFTATTTARSSGDAILVGELIAICKVDIAAAGTGACYIRGVHTITKTTAAAFTQGDSVYWDVTDGNFNLVATNNYYAGKVETAATTTEATTEILLNFGNASPR